VQIEHLKPGNSIVLRFDVRSPVRRGHHWIRFLHQADQGVPAPVVGVRFSVS